MGVLRGYLRPYRRVLVWVLALQTGQTIAGLLLPRMLARIIDRGVVRRDNGYLWAMGGWMLLVSLIQVVLTVAAVWFGSIAANGFGRDLRRSLFSRVMDYSAREVGRFGAPSLITRITNDVQQVQMLVQMGCNMAVAAPITLVIGTVLALQVDVGMSSLLLVSIPVLVTIVSLVIRRMVPTSRLLQTRLDTINRILREQITGIRVVRAFIREPAEIERFETANAEVTATSIRAGRLTAFMFPSMVGVLNLSSIAAVWIGAGRVSNGSTSVGALVAFLSYLAQILMSVMMASMVAGFVPRASACAERIEEVLATESSVVVPADAVTPTQRATVELRNATFRYPGAEAPVLAGVSVRSGPGETTAVIGSTGSGKTTLLNLVARLADVTEGAVLVGGVDVRHVEPDALSDRIGLVPQKPYLFSGTVASNLRYGEPDASDAELWEALQIAQAAEFVTAMDGGLDARVSQGGANLSGGQRQRLAIARAIVRRPEIYLFDDSFSALDLATDARLRAALAPITAESTVIVVAQRVSTIAGADRIVVLEDGECVGLGTHADLIATCPTYAEIVSSQLGLDDGVSV